jgi:hypothetical protein
MRDLVFAELTNHQLEVLERHLSKTLYMKQHLAVHDRQALISHLLRVTVEQRLRQIEGRTDAAALELFPDQLK